MCRFFFRCFSTPDFIRPTSHLLRTSRWLIRVYKPSSCFPFPSSLQSATSSCFSPLYRRFFSITDICHTSRTAFDAIQSRNYQTWLSLCASQNFHICAMSWAVLFVCKSLSTRFHWRLQNKWEWSISARKILSTVCVLGISQKPHLPAYWLASILSRLLFASSMHTSRAPGSFICHRHWKYRAWRKHCDHATDGRSRNRKSKITFLHTPWIRPWFQTNVKTINNMSIQYD